MLNHFFCEYFFDEAKVIICTIRSVYNKYLLIPASNLTALHEK